MPNPLYTYILSMFGFVWFGCISTLVGYFKPNPLYTYALNIYDLAWLVFVMNQLL